MSKLTIGTTNTHGVSKTASPMSDRAARGLAIAQKISDTTTKEQAVELLTGMRNDLRNRTGLVRLIHTTKTTGDHLAFQSFNKGWGNKTRTLETKEALIAYFDKAGLDQGELNNYLNSITERGHRIDGQRIHGILDNALKQPNNQPAPDRMGGQSSNGVVNQPLQNAPQIQPPQSGQTNPHNKQSMGGNAQHVRLSNADLKAGNFSIAQHENLDDSDEEAGFTMEEALEKSGIDRSNEQLIGKGGFGKAVEVIRNGETIVLKLPLDSSNINKFPKVTLDSLSQKPRLARTNEVTAAYLKAEQISNVCIPSDFLVHITRGGISSYEVVPTGQNFKRWALAELQSKPSPIIRIAGSIMPKAPGAGLERLLTGGQNQASQLGADDLKTVAQKSLESLRQFADHGFVHGDIKPLNMIYDSAGKQLTFIDMGGLAKISNDPALAGRTKFRSDRGVTRMYSHPSTLANQKVGHEQDFYSMGMTLLEASYAKPGKFSQFKPLVDSIDQWKKDPDPAQSIRTNLRDRVKPAPDSMEDLALRLIETSLERKEPVLRDDAKRILDGLANHKAVGGPGLPPVDPDSLKPPRNFTTSKAQVEVHEKERGVWKIDDFKDLGYILNNRDKGESFDLRFRINHPDLEADNLQDHLAEHAEKELNYFASFSPRLLFAKKRQEDFEALADSRKIIVEGPNPMDLTASQALDPDTLKDLNARLQARNLPTLEKLNTAFLPAFLSNQFMDGLLKPGSDQRTALSHFIYTPGGQISQTIRIREDGAILIEASRTRKADAVFDDGKKIALDPKQSSITEKFTMELRLPQAAPNKPPAAEIRILDASYDLKLCKA